MQTISYHKTSLISHGKREELFPSLEKTNWHSFQSSLLYVQAHICFPLSPLFSQSQSIPDGITALFHGNCLTWAGVSGTRADCQTEQAEVQLAVSANVKWQGSPKPGERIDSRSTFQSSSWSYQVNRRLNTKQRKRSDPALIVFLLDRRSWTAID